MTIRVALGEDNYLVREGIERLLATRDGIDVVAAVGDLDALIAAVDEHPIDVVVTDIRMPPGGGDEGIRLAERLRDTHPDVGVVVLSQYADAEFALALLERGAEGRAYLLKEHVHTVEHLERAIHAVSSGESMIDARVVEELVAAQTAGTTSRLDELTPREREILAHMAQGENNPAIATSLVLAENSVEKYVSSIFRKLGLTWEQDVHRRVKAVLLYLAETDGRGGSRGPKRDPA